MKDEGWMKVVERCLSLNLAQKQNKYINIIDLRKTVRKNAKVDIT
jgi:hypothetical protein